MQSRKVRVPGERSETRDPGISKQETGVPHLRRTVPLRYTLHRVRDTRVPCAYVQLAKLKPVPVPAGVR